MSKHAKPLLVLLTSVSVCALTIAATNTLESFKLVVHTEDDKSKTTYLVSEFEPLPKGKVKVLSESFLGWKCLSLFIATVGSSTAMMLADALQEAEPKERLMNQGKLELSEDALKFKYAKARKSQQLLHQQDLHELVALVGGSQDQQINEELASNKFMNAAAIENELGDRSKAVEMAFVAKKGTPEHEQFQSKYEEWLEKDE